MGSSSMAIQRNREEAINTQLAILISRLGVTADAETIHERTALEKITLPQLFEYLEEIRTVDAISGKPNTGL